jgi:hypothetical protein
VRTRQTDAVDSASFLLPIADCFFVLMQSIGSQTAVRTVFLLFFAAPLMQKNPVI